MQPVTTTGHSSRPIFVQDDDVHDNDVLSGSGRRTADHRGNKRFNILVQDRSDPNYRSNFSENSEEDIVKTIENLDPPGRFLKVQSKKKWQVMTPEESINKANRALSAKKRRNEAEAKAELDEVLEDNAALEQQLQQRPVVVDDENTGEKEQLVLQLRGKDEEIRQPTALWKSECAALEEKCRDPEEKKHEMVESISLDVVQLQQPLSQMKQEYSQKLQEQMEQSNRTMQEEVEQCDQKILELAEQSNQEYSHRVSEMATEMDSLRMQVSQVTSELESVWGALSESVQSLGAELAAGKELREAKKALAEKYKEASMEVAELRAELDQALEDKNSLEQKLLNQELLQALTEVRTELSVIYKRQLVIEQAQESTTVNPVALLWLFVNPVAFVVVFVLCVLPRDGLQGVNTIC